MSLMFNFIFYINLQNVPNDESDSNEEDREALLDNEYDTRYGKSFR